MYALVHIMQQESLLQPTSLIVNTLRKASNPMKVADCVLLAWQQPVISMHRRAAGSDGSVHAAGGASHAVQYM